jgi:hypothetical protein
VIEAGHWRRLAYAAAVSVAAHAAVVALGRIDVPREPDDRVPLAVRIVGTPPLAQPAVHANTPAPRTAPAAPGIRVATAAGVASPLAAAASREETDDTADVAVIEEPAATPPAEPVVVATAQPSMAAPEALPLRSLPRKGRITYNLVYGRDQFPVGRTIHSWEVDGERYQLASRSETTGIVDMIRSQQRTYSSRGLVTRAGLRPETFQSSRHRGRGSEDAAAQFDWENAVVKLGRVPSLRQESLPAHSQDLLSFVFQLSIDPPLPGRLRQVVTNGSRIETYELDVLREEMIETPLGVLRVLPVKQVRKVNEESIELWLAVEYRYLPVRLRFLNREGEAQGEQIVSEIRLSEN